MSYISDIVAATPIAGRSVKFQMSFSKDLEDIELAQEFRGRIFRNGAMDRDALDELAIHGIMRNQYGHIVCVFRMLMIEGDAVDQCYSAQFYDLGTIKSKGFRSLELGRFCVHPDYNDPDIFRLAWAEIAKYVQDNGVELLFGCSSFQGADALKHAEALSLLNERYLGPEAMRPRIKAPKIFPFAKLFQLAPIDFNTAYQSLPPLLRSYLNFGGWVSDHAVVDEDLNTVHVFTGVEIKNIPANKRKIFASLLARL